MPINLEDVQRLARRERRATRTKVNLLGVGGVGTNLLGVLARFADQFRVAIFDHDRVELHNLNRTRLFRLQDVGTPKVEAAWAVANQVSQACSGEEICYSRAVEEVDSGSALPTQAITIDARDTMDPTKMHGGAWLKLAYDGGSNIGFTFRPAVVAAKVVDLGGGSNYEVVPSFYVPAALLALLALNFLRYPNFLEITDLRAGTFHVEFDEMALSVCYAWSPEEEGEAGGGAAEARAEEEEGAL